MTTESYQCLDDEQRAICRRYGAEFVRSELASKLGISEEALRGQLPIHGLRHSPTGDVSGWYVWSGEFSTDHDFFKPLHVTHATSEPYARFLGLGPGWRFLLGEDGYEDVWFDGSLLQVDS